MLWSRSGFTGTQAFPGHWAGDNEPNFGADNGLPSVIVAGLSAAMSGWSIWGHDIGGYQEGNASSTPENLFMRWTQFGALTPIMQMHRQVGGGQQYPWSYGDAATDNYRHWAELHTQLFPYLYAYAAEAARSGLPIMRPPVLLHPGDPATHGLNHTYYLGDWLLAAPVITNVATTRTLYLPEGPWYDLATGEAHAGGAELTWASADQRRMPLFVRQGAIVPMLPAGTLSLIDVPDALEVHIWPAASSSFALHDGGTLACHTEAEQIVIDVDTRARPLALRVRSAEPLAVTRDGAAVPWSWADGVTTVDLAHAGGASAIALRFTADPVDPEVDAGGGGAGPPGGGGCGCAGGGGGGGGSPGALLLAFVAIMRAWRRRSSSRATASAGWPRG
jgi:alpha-glucosidase (family GH31 glycosyl hydrolase)